MTSHKVVFLIFFLGTEVVLNRCDAQYLIVTWVMLVDNNVTMRNDGRLIERWRMKLQTYLVEAKNQTFDKEKCYMWMKPS